MCSDCGMRQAETQTIALVGPTAVGKSALSIDLANELSAEVVNADSMQLYRGLDIGTGKLTVEQRLGVPHHLLDCWDLSHQASVQEYQERARRAIAEIHGRGRTALLVGGSGLYVSAVLDDLQFPGTDAAIRARWESELARVGSAELHQQLADRDPAAARSILPGNGRRIVRALEVIELTEQPFQATLGSQERFLPAVVIGLRMEREHLDERINRRVERMWADGWVDETMRLTKDCGLADAPTASRALGYQQILAMLRGELDEAQAKTDTCTATRRFARKQLSWFKRDASTQWIDVSDESPDELLETAMTAIP